MLNKLRLQLTALYFSVALGLVCLIGAGSYSLVQHYYLQTTDLALQYKMASQFEQYNLALPQSLSTAQQAWLANYSITSTNLPKKVKNTINRTSDDEGENDGSDQTSEPDTAYDDKYDVQLAAVFILPLDAQGNLIANPNPSNPPILRDENAYLAASVKGSDLRTIRLGNGTHVRLLTYRTSSQKDPAYIQVGRLLSDEDLILGQLLVGLFFLGGIVSIFMGGVSWWLSGRSLGPAQIAWDQQQMFVSNASHELRTPLTLIRATSEYGLRSQSGPDQTGLFKDIIQETDYMSRLVDDLLLLSRLDTHRLKLKVESIDLPELLGEVYRQVKKLAGEKGVNLYLESEQGTIRGDRARVRQVLLILLDNALRYTPGGGEIKIKTKASGKYWLIEVSDNGFGIPEAHLPHIFERFYQVNRPGTDATRSNGLGLSIARGLVETQSGSIEIASVEGKGTRVYVSFPSIG